jgi:hypothetical protein
LKKKYFSSHKLPKQQSTSFWSQGILGVKAIIFKVYKLFLKKYATSAFIRYINQFDFEMFK